MEKANPKTRLYRAMDVSIARELHQRDRREVVSETVRGGPKKPSGADHRPLSELPDIRNYDRFADRRSWNSLGTKDDA